MLCIVASYHWSQFQGKRLNQSWENDKNPSFGRTDFGPFGPNLGSENFVRGFDLYLMLGIVCHCMHFQGKLVKQVWENGKKPTLGVDFGRFGPTLGTKILFADFTPNSCYTFLQAINPCNFKENSWIKREKIRKKIVSGLNLEVALAKSRVWWEHVTSQLPWAAAWLLVTCGSPACLVVAEFSTCVLWPLMIGLMVVLLTFFSW